MFTLVYASTAAGPLSSGNLLALLHGAREKNTRLDVTGLLLYKDGTFMQALEGDEAIVRSLYAEIRQDARHHHVFTLLAIPIATRQFPTWSMGFKNLDGAQIVAVPGYDPNLRLPAADDALSWQASVAIKLLASFQQEN